MILQGESLFQVGGPPVPIGTEYHGSPLPLAFHEEFWGGTIDELEEFQDTLSLGKDKDGVSTRSLSYVNWRDPLGSKDGRKTLQKLGRSRDEAYAPSGQVAFGPVLELNAPVPIEIPADEIREICLGYTLWKLHCEGLPWRDPIPYAEFADCFAADCKYVNCGLLIDREFVVVHGLCYATKVVWIFTVKEQDRVPVWSVGDTAICSREAKYIVEVFAWSGQERDNRVDCVPSPMTMPSTRWTSAYGSFLKPSANGGLTNTIKLGDGPSTQFLAPVLRVEIFS